MSSQIIAFVGSPRKNGFSFQLLQELIKGAESRGASVKSYDLNDPGFRGCQGCYACRDSSVCVQQDTLQPFFTEVKTTTGIVVASPIYFADISGQTKMWLDRMFPMLDGRSFAPLHPGKRVVNIFAQGDGNPDRFKPAIERLSGVMRTFGWKIEDNIVCGGVGGAGFSLPEELKKYAFAAGEKLAE